MTTYREPSHYLSQLTSTTVPKRLLWLDCASSSSKREGVFVDSWRCGVLGQSWQSSKLNKWTHAQYEYENASTLWTKASDYCKQGKRVVLFAHDLATQLRISQALVHLPALGWQLDRIVLERTAAWCLMRHGKRTLMMCDLKSWTPAELATLASDVTGGRVNRFMVQAGSDFHMQVCRMRCDVVRDATLQILDMVKQHELGPFRPTGSGQSYAAFRRRFLGSQLLVHDDVQRIETERAAMWTGRCEAWKHGTLTDGPYVEYDMQAAYCRIASECDVPMMAQPAYDDMDVDGLQALMQTHAVMVDMTVTTDVPCIPTRHGGRTLWPTGTFRTVLWCPEVELAMAYASGITIHRVYPYTRGPAIRQFADYVLHALDNPDDSFTAVQRRVLKHWSRCMIGRLALRYRAWEHFGEQDPPDLRLITYLDTVDNVRTDMLLAGSKRLVLADMSESPESLPQIPGWIMSECRRRLWEAMARRGISGVVYVDTDSVIVDYGNEKVMRMLSEWMRARSWSVKGTYTRMTIHGPRNLACEHERRTSGIPRTARQIAPLEFSGNIMRSIKESMRAGQLDCVANIPRKFVLDAPDLRRQHLPNGYTSPFTITPSQPSEDQA